MKPPAAGTCVNCRAFVALGPDGSCPSCGLIDALRPLPTELSANRPNLKASVAYTATRIVTFFAAPALALSIAYGAWSSYDNVPWFAYPVVFFGSFFLGLLVGPAPGALLAYLPWLAVQCINRVAISPYRAFRQRRRVAPTFQGAFEKLARRRTELSEQMNQMHRTLGKVREALEARDARAVSSKQRLTAAEKALRSGIQARRDALETVDVVWYEVEYQLLECEIAGLRLLPCKTAKMARSRLARLEQIEPRLRAGSERAHALQDVRRRARALQASEATADRYHAAREHFQAVEDGGLLEQAAGLLKEVRPTQEHHHATPAVGAFATFDHGATLLRIGNAVAECVEEKLRVEAEIEAVAEVDAICDVESPDRAPRRGLSGQR